MRILIYGAGAIGGYMAVHLAQAGHEVTCIARGPHLAAMREKGLTLRIGDEERVADAPAAVGLGDEQVEAVHVALRVAGRQEGEPGGVRAHPRDVAWHERRARAGAAPQPVCYGFCTI